MTAHRHRAPDGRWHFQHGPIDLVIDAEGDASALDAAERSAWARFTTILDELVAELALLRMPMPALSRCPPGSHDVAINDAIDGAIGRSNETAVHSASRPRGVVARRMWDACLPHRARFVTPMAAVAGAVADELIEHYRRPGIRRAWINNGGDIALHLAPGASCRVGLFADLARFDLARWADRCEVDIDVDAHFDVTNAMPVRGIATSGWRGRSFSLGIADSVTVLARSAAAADAAATMIANAVDVDDARIVRRPASTLKDDSDLGDRLVTVDVPSLGIASVRRALSSGLARAEALQADGLIVSCVLVCQGMMAATRNLRAMPRGDFAPSLADAAALHATGSMRRDLAAVA